MLLRNLTISFLLTITFSALSQEKSAKIGFVDENRDGVNDLFYDANGDGVNDVDKKEYPHQFKYIDEDKDGINDLWVDADGDGVNDLARDLEIKFGGKVGRQWVDKDGDGVLDSDAPLIKFQHAEKHVLDMDGDGKNDITGIEYKGKNVMLGYRYGKIDEERGIEPNRFFDEDGDGMDDRFAARWLGKGGSYRHGSQDFFIDEDGDGICDGRRISGRGRGYGRGKGRR